MRSRGGREGEGGAGSLDAESDEGRGTRREGRHKEAMIQERGILKVTSCPVSHLAVSLDVDVPHSVGVCWCAQPPTLLASLAAPILTDMLLVCAISVILRAFICRPVCLEVREESPHGTRGLRLFCNT